MLRQQGVEEQNLRCGHPRLQDVVAKAARDISVFRERDDIVEQHHCRAPIDPLHELGFVEFVSSAEEHNMCLPCLETAEAPLAELVKQIELHVDGICLLYTSDA